MRHPKPVRAFIESEQSYSKCGGRTQRVARGLPWGMCRGMCRAQVVGLPLTDLTCRGRATHGRELHGVCLARATHSRQSRAPPTHAQQTRRSWWKTPARARQARARRRWCSCKSTTTRAPSSWRTTRATGYALTRSPGATGVAPWRCVGPLPQPRSPSCACRSARAAPGGRVLWCARLAERVLFYGWCCILTPEERLVQCCLLTRLMPEELLVLARVGS
jgi:hypothetical protein